MMLHLGSTATELSRRLCDNFPRGEWDGREVLGGAPILQKNLQVPTTRHTHDVVKFKTSTAILS
jgi:hypothetical protein